MPMNKVKTGSNMYQFLNDNGGRGYTWNVIKGKCPHLCNYCYCKRWGKQRPLHFDEKELKTDLGSGNFIFVGSSCDMWAQAIPKDNIGRILDYCGPGNRYLFQSKNPARFNDFLLPKETLLGTTIESNRCCCDFTLGAPCTCERYFAMGQITNRPKMISIEPIMDFDLDVMVRWMQEIKPEFVSIGADSGNNHLPEPPADKVQALIKELEEFTMVKIKDNLKRILRVKEGEGIR